MTLVKQIAILAGVGLLVAGVLATDVLDAVLDVASEEATAVKPGGSAGAPAPVVVEAVRHAGGAAVVELVGTGEAAAAVTLYPEAAGRVTEVRFEAGQRVKRGAALLRLDAEAEELALELAKVRLQDARQQLARFERAAPSGAVSASEVDRAQTALSAGRIELAQAELALRDRTLVAPFDGVVGIPAVDVGDRVTEATEIATLDDRSFILVDFEVPEAFGFGVRRGGPVEATTWAIRGETFSGVVESYASRIDPLKRTVRVRARLANEEDRLRTGMSFTIRLPLQGERFPSVPAIALQWDREGAYVWRVVDGAAERVAVDVLKREDRWVLLDAPLDSDDRVVIEGVQRLTEGRKVEVVAADPIAKEGADGV